MFYSKWETEESIVGNLVKLDKKSASIPIIKNEKGIFGLNKDNHNMIIGSDAMENLECVTMPFLKSIINAGESFLINDTSGKVYKNMHGKLNGYNKVVINFNNLKDSDSFNPLYVPYTLYKTNKDKALRMLEDVGYYLLNEGKIEGDPFWENTSIDYFCGLTMYLFETKDLVSIKDVFDLSTSILENNSKDEFLNNIDKKSDIYAYLVGTMNTAKETYQSILSVFHQKIKKYVVGDIVDLLRNDNYNMNNILNKKSAIFIIGGIDNFSSHIVPLITSQLSTLCEINKNSKRIEFILDDFDSLLAIRDFARILKYSSITDIRYTVIASSYKTIINKYGSETFVILELCFPNLIYLLSNDMDTLKKISKYCGNINENGKDMPLVSTTELKHFKYGDAIIIIPRYYPFKTNLL